MLNIGPAVRLPDAPRADPVAPVAPLKSGARREEEDPDLADLASWAKLGNVLLIKEVIKIRRLILRLPL